MLWEILDWYKKNDLPNPSPKTKTPTTLALPINYSLAQPDRQTCVPSATRTHPMRIPRIPQRRNPIPDAPSDGVHMLPRRIFHCRLRPPLTAPRHRKKTEPGEDYQKKNGGSGMPRATLGLALNGGATALVISRVTFNSVWRRIPSEAMTGDGPRAKFKPLAWRCEAGGCRLRCLSGVSPWFWG